MTKKTLAAVVISFLLTGAVTSIYAVDISLPGEGMIQIIETTDGSILVGMITDINDNAVTVETELGELSIAPDKIVKIREVPAESIKRGKHWFTNPNNVRLFLSPTARPIPKGTGYVADYMLFLPYVAYGITDHVSLEGGISFIPGLGFGQFIYYRPKLAYQIARNVSLGGGLMGAFSLPLGYMDAFAANFLFGVGTFGSPDYSVTVGLAYGAITEIGYGTEWMELPGIMLGGEFRVARGVSIVTENYYVPDIYEEAGLISYGLRFFGEQFSVNVGFVVPIEDYIDEIFPGIPVLAVAYHF